MSSYHLHGRRFAGSLRAPETNELHSEESSSRDEVLERAKRLSWEGYSVWVYEHAHATDSVNHGPYKVIAEFIPNGLRVR